VPALVLGIVAPLIAACDGGKQGGTKGFVHPLTVLIAKRNLLVIARRGARHQSTIFWRSGSKRYSATMLIPGLRMVIGFCNREPSKFRCVTSGTLPMGSENIPAP
jgi:hypothetical protein